jgi:predicted tellurium resistance membrane protein TerC
LVDEYHNESHSITLAAAQFAPAARRPAMLWGSGLAIMTRLLLTAGAVLLAYIACNLIQEEAQLAAHVHEAPTSMRSAIARIALAHLVMSLDNVIAIAGASQFDPVRATEGDRQG